MERFTGCFFPIVSVGKSSILANVPTYTLTLDDDTAKRLGEIVKTFGGSVPNFARLVVSDLAQLPIDQIQQVRHELSMRAEESRQRQKKRA